MRPTDLRDSLQRAISLVTKAYSDKAIELSLSVPDGAAVLADDLLDEVFANILSNSVKYTQGQTVSISIKTEPMERGVGSVHCSPGRQMRIEEAGESILKIRAGAYRTRSKRRYSRGTPQLQAVVAWVSLLSTPWLRDGTRAT